MSRGGLAGLTMVCCAALAVPASSPAASVGVEELQTEPRQANVVFVAGPGEANDMDALVVGEEGQFYDLRLLDAAASIEPGPGCSGGGGPGVAVHCKVHKPTPGDNFSCFKICQYTAGTKWDLRLTFKLGDAGSRLDTTALPAGASDPRQPWMAPAPISLTVTPGAGDDTVLTGPGPDLIESSPGADLVRTGDGSDEFDGGSLPDGPDHVDLGEGVFDRIDYSERGSDVRYDPNGLADDGAAGEGDNLGVADAVETGPGADTLAASPELRNRGQFIGGAGDDTIHGGAGGDEIFGGEGNDELVGGAGDDSLTDPSYGAEGSNSGNDTGAGGAGDDEISLGSGDDEVFGGAGEDRIELGPGDDRAAGDRGRDLIQLGPGQDRGAGGAGDDLVLGEQGEDEIHGERGDDRLSGDVGRDSLFGGGGDDRIAAGMVVASALPLREFLGSLGPLEGKPDRVQCGAGRDDAKTGRGDSAAGCESTPRAELLELGELVQSDGDLSARLDSLIRRPGTIELEGKGVQPKQLVSEYDYRSWDVPLWPVGRSLRALLRDGHVKLRLKLAFHAAGGREAVRIRTVDLWLPVDLESRRRVR